MNFLFPALAAVLQSASYVFDKATLSLKRVSYPTYLTISFPLMAFGNFIAYLLFAPAIPLELFEGKLFWMLAVTILISAGSNVSFYKALDSDNLSEVETLDLFFNLPVIIFSSLLFADERNPYILIPALISSAAIIWSHWQKGHFRMKKKTLYYCLWIVLVGPFLGHFDENIAPVVERDFIGACQKRIHRGHFWRCFLPDRKKEN